ncbi:hypothetical protein Kpho01_12650 [Kitasatospora phosalacinea]|uniref:Uncharacterized protein n=1 Tax=Kitasatospora phosalacinea TaxID=2065 RepID=A0A9W6PE01_9ACTN|nr:hypothetical protein Kpho01_12650 [Kitasatospora phosalacinea]
MQQEPERGTGRQEDGRTGTDAEPHVRDDGPRSGCPPRGGASVRTGVSARTGALVRTGVLARTGALARIGQPLRTPAFRWWFASRALHHLGGVATGR